VASSSAAHQPGRTATRYSLTITWRGTL